MYELIYIYIYLYVNITFLYVCISVCKSTLICFVYVLIHVYVICLSPCLFLCLYNSSQPSCPFVSFVYNLVFWLVSFIFLFYLYFGWVYESVSVSVLNKNSFKGRCFYWLLYFGIKVYVYDWIFVYFYFGGNMNKLTFFLYSTVQSRWNMQMILKIYYFYVKRLIFFLLLL